MYRVTFANIVRYEKLFDATGEFSGYNYDNMLEPITIAFDTVDDYRNWSRNPNNRKQLINKWR
jgi:hypothetical protein